MLDVMFQEMLQILLYFWNTKTYSSFCLLRNYTLFLYFEVFRWAISSSTNIFFSEEYDMQLLCKLHRLNKIASYNPQTISANDFYFQIIIFF